MNCPICDSGATSPALSGSDFLLETSSCTFNLNACGKCSCLFLDPLPSAKEMDAFYPSRYWRRKPSSAVLAILERAYRRMALRDHIGFITRAARNMRSDSLRLVDVGCGTGMLLGLLNERGFDVVGLDV